MDKSRRKFLQGAAVLGAGLVAVHEAQGASQQRKIDDMKGMPAAPGMKDMPGMEPSSKKQPTSAPRRANHGGVVPMQTPDVPDLPFEIHDGVKVFKIRAEPVIRKILPFKTMKVWGYNGSCPGPTIQVQQGDRVRVIFENGLPEATTLHWHGLEVPIEMDGVPFISQKPVPPGGSFTYEFTVHQEGTFFYHSHGAM